MRAISPHPILRAGSAGVLRPKRAVPELDYKATIAYPVRKYFLNYLNFEFTEKGIFIFKIITDNYSTIFFTNFY